jgi:hypothetical protein
MIGRGDHSERDIRKRTGIPDLPVALRHTLQIGCGRAVLRERFQAGWRNPVVRQKNLSSVFQKYVL